MVVADVACAGLGAAITDSIFNPLEVVKVRLQTAAQHGGAAVTNGATAAATNGATAAATNGATAAATNGAETAVQAASSLWQRGGPRLLWSPGLQATWVRAFGFTGLRVGLYPTVRNIVSGDSDGPPSLAAKVTAGAATGALGSAIANPVDLIRTRMQAQAGRPTLYDSSLAVARHVVSDGGVAALWRGVGATAVRATLLSGAQLATYDQLKEELKASGWVAGESSALHVGCGFMSGLVGQTVCQPADTIKSRVLAGGYTSVAACLRDTIAREGLRGLYRGYWPAVARQCPVVLVQMPLIERIRAAAGLEHI